MDGGVTLMTIESALVTVLALASVTLKVILLVPDVVGVPVTIPVPQLRVRPAGKVPDDMDQVSAALPPVAVKV
jgi:hypothetical protein